MNPFKYKFKMKIMKQNCFSINQKLSGTGKKESTANSSANTKGFHKGIMLTIALVWLTMLQGNAQTMAMNTGNGQPAYKWVTDTVVSIGKVEVNNPQTVTFEFINKGTAPLLITKVQPSCGCTSVDFSKNPVAPGEKGFVKTTYNAASIGVFHKTLTVFANTPAYSTLLAIKGEVVEKK
jgi:hypothetical protein